MKVFLKSPLTTTQIWQILSVGVAVFLLTFILTHQLWKSGFPYTHDGENHLARFANYYVALKEGQVPPRFAPNLHNHYGYPVFNYNYPLANILSVPFTILDITIETTYKILATLAVALGVSGCIYWLRLRNSTWLVAVLGAWGALISPAVLNILLFRGNIGEVWAWGLLPWLLGGVEVFLQGKSLSIHRATLWLILTAFLLSHNVTVLFGIGFVWFYASLRYLYTGRPALFLRQFLVWQLVSLASACWFWLPALFEKKFITLDGVDLSKSFAEHFPTLTQLISSPISFGFSQIGSIDSLSFSIGIWLTIVLLFVLGFLLLKGIQRTHKQLFSPEAIMLVLLLVVFQLAFTSPIWQIVPFAQFIQFPWRLSLLLSVISASFFLYWPRWPKMMQLLVLMACVVQSIIIFRAVPVDRFHRTNDDYIAFSQTTTTQNENMPKTFHYQNIADWQPTPSILTGSAVIDIKRWTGSARTYTVNVITPTIIIEPTMNFPGWQTWVTPMPTNNSEIDNLATQSKLLTPYIDSDIIQGRLAYSLEPGMYQVRTRFTEWTLARLTGDFLTIVGVCLAFIWTFLLPNQ